MTRSDNDPRPRLPRVMAGTAMALLAAATLAAPGCASTKDASLQDAVESVVGDFDELLGQSTAPGELMRTIRSVHMPGTWDFDPAVEEALEITRAAIRELAVADYTTWNDAGLITHAMSSIATDHPAGLVRAEAIDTLARIGRWVNDARRDPPFVATEEQVIDALKIVRDARGKNDSDPRLTADVARAVMTIESYTFDAPLPPEETAPAMAARAYRDRLGNARGVLIALIGDTLAGFRADTEIRESLDRAFVSLSLATVRLTLYAAAANDASDTAREAAVRRLGLLRAPHAPVILRRLLARSEKSSVRRAAAMAMHGMESDEVTAALIDALTDESPTVRSAVVRSLESVTGEKFGGDRNAWRAWWAERSAAPGSVRND